MQREHPVVNRLEGRGSSFQLQDGSRVAVIGGGPAGSFFAIFLIDMARRVEKEFVVDIYEPRNFLNPGPAGCNMCAGIVSETLAQSIHMSCIWMLAVCGSIHH
jgi:hypothetical protein